ncbi:FtsX-like permease family protein [Paenimyroides tangerinum]|uniref:FtsX-like permease family protein n=1 Tax=Paenimyroides tangerinum TaxID=2488728 RepID=A0A3P3W7S4_9FLAO|nr:FtsX-like permease family protein [Paenimyroides tangerinum]RRJ91211.1 FtsX-like permease family protein [Paenimyroides tangerinum]
MFALAWKFIRFDKAKSVGIITAIVISIFLIGQQVGLLLFLMGLMGNLVGNANVKDNQIWVIESQTQNANTLTKIDLRYVQQLQSINGVEQAFPVVIGNAEAKFLDGNTAAVQIIGSDAPDFVIGPNPTRIFQGNLSDLSLPEAVSVEFFNAKSWNTDLYLNKQIELNSKSAQVKLITKNAQAFGGNYVYTNLFNARFYGNVDPSKVSLIVLNLDKNSNKQNVINLINSQYPNLRAWDTKALQNSTVKEILISSNMGMSFGTLVVFAMISGFFIIGLTLYSSALDRVKDYGTLKAIGANKTYVNKLLITQALLYALIGFSVAFLLLIGFSQGVKKSGLEINFSLGFVSFLLGITLFISIGGSLFAVRKISKLEPASVF